MVEEMRDRVPALRHDLDEWTRRMMRWHFSDDTGSAFWLSRRERLPFDPVRDVTGFGALSLFGYFDKRELRAARVRDLMPRGFAGRPFRVVETGGSTGRPCRVVDVTRGTYDVAMFRAMLEARGLVGGDVLAMTPSGPHAYGHFVSRLAASWAGAALFIDFDPRWAKELVRAEAAGWSREDRLADYVGHLVRQTHALLADEHPQLLFTTSRLMAELVTQLPRPLADYGVRAVCTGGTACTAEERRYLQEEHLAGVQWIDTYGNTLVGHALQADPVGATHAAGAAGTHSYHLPPPLAVLRVVDPDRPEREVAVGVRGRVLAVTLLEDLFIPNLLERDSAVRTGPHPWFPWDGLTAVGPYTGAGGRPAAEVATEGVY